MIELKEKIIHDDLADLRDAAADYEVLRLRICPIDPISARKIVTRFYGVHGRIIEDYGVDVEQQWNVSPFDGSITYGRP